ncbi:MAG: sulfite exporter TauE/SafE family protein [Terriglobia bacterium]
MMTVLVIGFLTGLLIGMTGTGGGSLLTPLLLIFTPYSTLVIIGTDLVTGVITKLAGLLQHWRLGPIYWRLAAYVIIGSLPGSAAGVFFIHILRAHLGATRLDEILKGFIGLALLAASFSLPYVRRRKRLAPHSGAVMHISNLGCAEAGAMVGFLVALTSVGSGSLMMVFLLLVTPVPIAELVGTDIMLGFATTILAASLHLWRGHFDQQLFFALVAGSVPGVLLGSWFSHRIPDRYFGWALSALYFSLGTRLLLRL